MLTWMLCFFITMNMITLFVFLGSPTWTILLPSILTRPQNGYKSGAENSSYQINYLLLYDKTSAEDIVSRNKWTCV